MRPRPLCPELLAPDLWCAAHFASGNSLNPTTTVRANPILPLTQGGESLSGIRQKMLAGCISYWSSVWITVDGLCVVFCLCILGSIDLFFDISLTLFLFLFFCFHMGLI